MSCSGTGLRWCNFSRPRHVVLIEVRGLQHGEVLGRRLPGHGQRAAELAERLAVALVQPVEQLPAGRVGQCLEHEVQVVGHVAHHAGIYLHVNACPIRSTVMPIAAPVDDDDVPRYWRELGLPGPGRRPRALPARPGAGQGVAVLRRRAPALRHARGRCSTRCPIDERLADPRPARRAGVPDAALPAPAGHGGLAQRLVGGVRARPIRRCCSRRRSIPSPRRRSTWPRRSTAAPGCSRCTCRSAASTPATRCSIAVWARLAETGTPIVIHCGSGPRAGEHTGPGPIAELLERYPRLQLVIAHLGHARVPRLPRPGRALRAGAPGHHDVRDRLHPGADALRPAPICRGWALCGTRCCSGTDFPSIPYPYAHQLAALHRLDLGEEWLRAVLWHNGARLFRIEP